MVPLERRIQDRLRAAGATVDPQALPRFVSYVELLAKWNRSINLTALQMTPISDAAIDRLLVEPALAAAYLLDTPDIWFDLGSGGGSPAIPMKILRPSFHLTMIEATAKKAAFLREAVREVRLEATDLETARFEVLAATSPIRGQGHLVTTRAVRTGRELFQAAAGLLIPGGQLWFFRSSGSRAEFRPVEPFRHKQTAPLGGNSSLEIMELGNTAMFHVEQNKSN